MVDVAITPCIFHTENPKQQATKYPELPNRKIDPESILRRKKTILIQPDCNRVKKTTNFQNQTTKRKHP